jgi:hypothetical protein
MTKVGGFFEISRLRKPGQLRALDKLDSRTGPGVRGIKISVLSRAAGIRKKA